MTVLLQVDDGVATLTLDRPDSLNAFDLDLASRLRACIDDVTRSDARVLVLAGAGRAFSAGGDVRAMAQSGDPADYLRRLTTGIHAALAALRSLPVPVIARVHGAVAGGGLGLVLASDVVIASEEASFTAAYGAIGLSPDCGVSALLPAVVGLGRARAFLVGGMRIDAATATAWGLATSVVPASELDDAVRAAVLAAGRAGREATAVTRGLLVDDDAYRARLAIEADAICALAAGPAAARIAGFAARRA